MRKAALENELRRHLNRSRSDEKSFPNYGNLLSLAGAELGKKPKRRGDSFAGILFRLIRLSGWKIWIAQAVFVGIARMLPMEIFLEYSVQNPFRLMRWLACMSVLITMPGLPFLSRSARYNMRETEAATRFGPARLFMARLAVTGMGDVTALALLFISALHLRPARPLAVFFCMAVPFLAVSGGKLFLLGHCTAGGFWGGTAGIGGMLILAAAVFCRDVPTFGRSNFSIVFCTVCCAALLVFCFCQIVYIRDKFTAEPLSAA